MKTGDEARPVLLTFGTLDDGTLDDWIAEAEEVRAEAMATRAQIEADQVAMLNSFQRAARERAQNERDAQRLAALATHGHDQS